MKKCIIILMLALSLGISPALGEKLAVIKEVLKPTFLVVDDSQFYVSEETTIFIYSLKDFKLVKKFGSQGEGPQEFLYFAAVVPQKDQLLVNSFGKVSYYTKNGEFLKELKANTGFNLIFQPLENGFISVSTGNDKGKIFTTINLLDAEMKKIKELARMDVGDLSKRLDIFKRSFSYQTHANKIYITAEKGLAIDVFDHTGNKLQTISHEYQKIKFDPKVEELIRDSMKKRNPAQYEQTKNIIHFPEYFPEILNFSIDENKILVSTWKWEKDKIEFYIFDLQGKFLKKLFIPFAFQDDGMTPFPSDIKKGKLYQLVENEDEELELHVNPIE